MFWFKKDTARFKWVSVKDMLPNKSMCPKRYKKYAVSVLVADYSDCTEGYPPDVYDALFVFDKKWFVNYAFGPRGVMECTCGNILYWTLLPKAPKLTVEQIKAF